MAVNPEQRIQQDGIPQNPALPFSQDLADRLSYVNIFIKEHARKAAKSTNVADREYEQYLAELGHEEKGFLLGEAIYYQAHPDNERFFGVTIRPGETVVFALQQPDAKEYKTESRLSEVRLPGKIETSEQAHQYASEAMDDGIVIPEPIDITHQELVELGRKLDLIKQIEKNPKGKSPEEIRQFLRLKDHYIDKFVLPARRGKLPQDCRITVDLLKDSRGRTRNDRVRITIHAGKHTFTSNTLTPDNRHDNNGPAMQKQIGKYDLEIEEAR